MFGYGPDATQEISLREPVKRGSLGAKEVENKEVFLSLGMGDPFPSDCLLCGSAISFPVLSSHFLTHMLGLRSTKAFDSS